MRQPERAAIQKSGLSPKPDRYEKGCFFGRSNEQHMGDISVMQAKCGLNEPSLAI
jgi:hypothetical protein